MAVENPREIRAIEIAAKGNEIKRLNASAYRVRSQSNPDKWYLVVKDDFNEWSCECLDYVNRRTVCKHVYSTRYSQNLRQRVTEQNLNLEGKNTIHDQLC